MIDSVYKLRAIRAEILRRVNHAMDVSEFLHGYYLVFRDSKFPRGRRYAIRCRAQAVVIHDRELI